MNDRLFQRLTRMLERAADDGRERDVCELYWALVDECTPEQWEASQPLIVRAISKRRTA